MYRHTQSGISYTEKIVIPCVARDTAVLVPVPGTALPATDQRKLQKSHRLQQGSHSGGLFRICLLSQHIGEVELSCAVG